MEFFDSFLSLMGTAFGFAALLFLIVYIVQHFASRLMFWKPKRRH